MLDDKATDSLSLAVQGNSATVTLARPPVNAINESWIDRLNAVLDEIEVDREVSVVWIRSNERTFCAGADLAMMRSRFETDAGRQMMVGFARRLQEVFARLEVMPAVCIAEIGGAALGGGFELALCCDLRVVSETAKLGLPEARLGLLPGAGGTQRLTRLCGDGVARRLILAAEVINGVEAVALGAAHWAVPAESLRSFTADLVAKIASLPRDAVAECKACIAAALQPNVNGFEMELTATSRLLRQTQTQDRVKQFLESRN